MNKSDLKFETMGRYETIYFVDMLFDEYREFAKNVAEEILEQAIDTNDFIDKYLNDNRVVEFYGRNRLAKYFRPKILKRTIRNFLGDRIFLTTADAGSVLIGNKDLKIMIPNGYGDGKCEVAILDKDEDINIFGLDNFTLVNGEFKIYNYDCTKDEEDYAEKINGRYSIYHYDGFVVFQELE